MTNRYPSNERVWVLADDRAGNVAQSVGVAEALGMPFSRIEVRYDILGALPNVFRAAGLLGVTRDFRATLTPPWPELVIGAGRRTAPVARWLKRRCGCRLVQIMDPGWPGRADFDLIAAPMHDGAPRGSNAIPTVGSCHRVTPSLLASEENRWKERLASLSPPYLLLVVGGDTKSHPFGVEHARQLVTHSLRLAEAMGATILVTTSRRTRPEVEAVIVQAMPQSSSVYCWRQGAENPYIAFLARADAIVVTGDSMSMCSEACATGCPVYLFAPPGLVNAKYARLHQLLYDRGYARPLGVEHVPWTHPPLNASLDVARVVRARGLIGTVDADVSTA
jgi:hypothetical protein